MDRDGGLAGAVPDGMDVAAGAAAGHARRDSHRLGPGRDREATLVQLALHADEPDARAIVVVEAGLLPRHPGENPDVDPLVFVEELVATPLAVDDDERL